MDDLVAPTTTSLAPGFRFHPTDEELVRYYLRRKVCGKSFRFDAISEVDVYKCEPWDLPDKSRLKSRDLEWYFFSVLDKKFGNGSRTNRATGKGYWKTTGKDREVLNRTRTVGMKKTLVYHIGRAPRGERTNWVMHEYRLVDEELKGAGIGQGAFVLCRIFQKTGSGPKNGAQYGAPFIEEEWEDDELVMIPGEENVPGGDVVCVDGLDLEQILDATIPPAVVPLPNFDEDNRNSAQSADSSGDAQKLLLVTSENCCGLEQTADKQNLFHMEENHLFNHDSSISEPHCNTVVDPEEEADYLLDEPFLDATNNNPLFNDGSFLETNDLSNPVEADQSFDMLEEYLTYFDADGDLSFFNEGGDLSFFNEGSYCMGFDSTMMVGNEKLTYEGGASIDHKLLLNGGGTMMTNKQTQSSPLEGGTTDAASSSSKLETPPQVASSNEDDVQYPVGSRMLGSIHAPPAFAAEFPTKDAAAALRLISSSSSSSAHIATGRGMIEDWSVVVGGKQQQQQHDDDDGRNINILLSFDLMNSASVSMESSRWWWWRWLNPPMLVWGVLLLSMSYKMVTLLTY